MLSVIYALWAYLGSTFRSREALRLENMALRHQVAVYQRTVRARPGPMDRLFWAWLARLWVGWQEALVVVQPRTILAWQRQRFRDHWRRMSQQRKPGRPGIATDVRNLIQEMFRANPIAFLHNHVRDFVSMDFFVVPTVTHKVLFVLLILAHHRRRVVHFNVTEHPTAPWAAQQVIEAFPWNDAPRYLLRDRDRIYGAAFRQRIHGLGMTEVVTAPQSPWQNPYVERLIGSIRLECLDHMIVLSERHLTRVLTSYLGYDHTGRTHLALEMDSPERRPIQPPANGRVIAVPEVGGLHHHYERQAA
jgi:putative transposase